MKKKIVLLSALGLAGGLLYTLESQHKRNKSESADDRSGDGQAVPDASLRQTDAPQSKPAGSMAKIEEPGAQIGIEGEHAIDDQGTDQSEASQILRSIRDNAFEASDEKLALALGRPTQEIEEWINGNGLIDGDVILKARTLAMQRGLEI